MNFEPWVNELNSLEKRLNEYKQIFAQRASESGDKAWITALDACQSSIDLISRAREQIKKNQLGPDSVELAVGEQAFQNFVDTVKNNAIELSNLLET